MSATADLRKRRGKFEIPIATLDENPEVVQELMGQVIVVACDSDLAKQVLRYTVISGVLDEVEDGADTPNYNVDYDGEKFIWVKE